MSTSPLTTDSINELDFRHFAGLCELCGVARNDEGITICAMCRQAKNLRRNEYLKVPKLRKLRKRKVQ